MFLSLSIIVIYDLSVKTSRDNFRGRVQCPLETEGRVWGEQHPSPAYLYRQTDTWITSCSWDDTIQIIASHILHTMFCTFSHSAKRGKSFEESSSRSLNFFIENRIRFWDNYLQSSWKWFVWCWSSGIICNEFLCT